MCSMTLHIVVVCGRFGLYVSKGLLPTPQATCKALALLVAASSDAKQQVMSMGDHDLQPWPEVALMVRQVSCICCDGAHQASAET